MDKQPFTLDEQADLLLSRGLIASKSELISLLRHTNYYKLSGYFYIFQDKSNNSTFYTGTEIQTIVNLYHFDNALRNLALLYLSLLEVSISTNIAYHFSIKTASATPHKDSRLFYVNNPTKFNDFQNKAMEARTRSEKEAFVKHHAGKEMPLWVLVEILTWGDLLELYSGILPYIQKEIRKMYNLSPSSFESILNALRILRNKCSHNSRVYNSASFLRVSLPHPDQNTLLNKDLTMDFKDNKIFLILTILKYFTNIINPNNTLTQDLDKLIEKYQIDTLYMGVINNLNWKEHPIWQNRT